MLIYVIMINCRVVFELETIQFSFICIVGDYSNARGTLIGALFANLGISTRELSKDKEMDLRTHYSCWLSKPLPLDLPFGRLLCFEKLDIIEKLILLKKYIQFGGFFCMRH